MAADPAVGRADAGVALVASPDVRRDLEGLYARHGARVLAYCRRRLGSQEEAEDALQTTFLYACRGLQRGVVPETEIAWLLKIAHNVCLSHWDSNRRRRRLELVQDPGVLDHSAPAPPSERENAMALDVALAELTDLQRQAILLREWRGLAYQEIADELSLSASAVETLIFRARRSLARSLERQDVGRSRTRLARALDFSGLLPALKSLLGAAGGTKVAAGLAVGAALVAGSIPDVPTRSASEAPAAVAPQSSLPAPAQVPLIADPALLPDVRAAAERDRVEKQAAAKKKAAKKQARLERRAERRGETGQGEQGGAGPASGVGQVASGLGATVGALTDTVNGTVGGVVDTVNGVVEDTADVLPDVLPPVLDTVPPILDTVPPLLDQVLPPALDVVDGVLGGQRRRS